MTDRPPFVLLPSDMEEDDEVDPNDCRVCHSPGFCPPGYEPTGICLSCAVDEIAALTDRAEKAEAELKEARWPDGMKMGDAWLRAEVAVLTERLHRMEQRHNADKMVAQVNALAQDKRRLLQDNRRLRQRVLALLNEQVRDRRAAPLGELLAVPRESLPSLEADELRLAYYEGQEKRRQEKRAVAADREPRDPTNYPEIADEKDLPF